MDKGRHTGQGPDLAAQHKIIPLGLKALHIFEHTALFLNRSQQLLTFLRQTLHPAGKLCRVAMGQPFANALHRALHIAFGAVNQRNTQIPHSGRQFLLEDGQGFVRGTRHQHMLTLRQKMPQQIGNGMGLARARRPLHHHRR